MEVTLGNHRDGGTLLPVRAARSGRSVLVGGRMQEEMERRFTRLKLNQQQRKLNWRKSGEKGPDKQPV